MHAAEATRIGRGYRGHGVHTAARIGALAGGDEIVASAATIAGVAGVSGVDARPATLKGLAEPVDVVTVDWS